MDLDLNLRMAAWSGGPAHNLRLAKEAERLGFRAVWTEEAYGNDAVVPLAWIAACTDRIGIGSAVWQISGRSAATAAMTAATLDLFSEGRLRVGLGVSGPQVVEGWHGAVFDKPITRTREYVEVLRLMLERAAPVQYSGQSITLPAAGGTGLGKPLKLILHPLRADVPIYVGALGPRNVQLTAEIADGWIPVFLAPESMQSVFGADLAAGFGRAKHPKAVGAGFDVAPIVHVVLGDDVDECRDELRERIALYIGGMGSSERNFSNSLVGRLGFEEVAEEVQRRYLGGDRQGAAEAVTDALVDAVALVGPRERIIDRLAAWREAGITTLILDTEDETAMRVIAEAVL